MKCLNYVILSSLILLGLTACGGSQEKKVYDVTVDNTTIGGKLSEYFTLENKTYKYRIGSTQDDIAVEIRCIRPIPENMQVSFGMDVIDKNGNIISVYKPKYSEWSELLRQASPGQIVTIEIHNTENVKKDIPAKIRLSSMMDTADEEPYYAATVSTVNYDSDTDDDDNDDNDNYNDDSNHANTSGSSDIDKFLDSYDAYVTKYVSYSKKIANGDMSAMMEFASLMEKAQELSTKIEKSTSDMSSAQLNRYLKITQKMTDAMRDMH